MDMHNSTNQEPTIDMRSHSFNVGIAKDYSVNMALWLRHLEFWTEHNIAHGKNTRDGCVWSYSTISALTVIFPYFTYDQIRRLIQSSIDVGLVKKGNYNKNSYDRTGWYALTDKALVYFPYLKTLNRPQPAPSTKAQNCQMDSAELPNGFGENHNTIPDTKTDTKNIRTSSSLFDTSAVESLLSFRERHESHPEVEEEEFLRMCEAHIENRDKSKYNLQQALHGLRKLIAQGTFGIPAGYKGLKEKTKPNDSQKPRIEYQEYCGRIKADIGLKLIDSDTKPLSFGDWLNKNNGDNKNKELNGGRNNN